MADQKKQLTKNEYAFNRPFKDYVDKFCEEHKISIEEAITLPIIRRAALWYSGL